MARFSYLAIDPDGRERRGGMDASDERAVRSALEGKKLYPVEVALSGDRSAPKVANEQRGPVRGALRHKDRMLVTRQLATLIGAAVSVDEALGILAAQQESATVRRILADMRAGIQEGMRLADVMGRHKGSFPNAYRAAIAGGERSGNLGPVLNRLANYLQREQGLGGFARQEDTPEVQIEHDPETFREILGDVKKVKLCPHNRRENRCKEC